MNGKQALVCGPGGMWESEAAAPAPAPPARPPFLPPSLPPFPHPPLPIVLSMIPINMAKGWTGTTPSPFRVVQALFLSGTSRL